MDGEHRREVRRKTLKGGLIAFNDGRSTIACTIRNLSSGGARLEVASAVGIPDEFVLVFDGNEASPHCRVRRRSATSLGVEFVP